MMMGVERSQQGVKSHNIGTRKVAGDNFLFWHSFHTGSMAGLVLPMVFEAASLVLVFIGLAGDGFDRDDTNLFLSAHFPFIIPLQPPDSTQIAITIRFPQQKSQRVM